MTNLTKTIENLDESLTKDDQCYENLTESQWKLNESWPFLRTFNESWPFFEKLMKT